VSINSEKLAALEGVLGHSFSDRQVLVTALTHASLPRQPTNYERLEFLGDRVLGLIVAEMLYRLYPEEKEGDLAKRLTEVVQQKTLVSVAAGLGIAPYLRLSAGEKKAGGTLKDTILADAVEALIGAIYLDGGLEAARRFVERHWQPLVATRRSPPDDPKTRLQEVAQARGLALPQYKLLAKTGSDHAPVFDVEVSVTGMGSAQARAASKRAAEKEAAQKLLETTGEAT
jgi:ribonuclease III